MAKLVSKVYGEALFEAAVDHGNAIQLMNETAQLEKILEDNPDFDTVSYTHLTLPTILRV